MQPNRTNYTPTAEPQPLRSLLMLVGFVLLGMTFGNALALALVALLPMAGGGPTALLDLLQHPADYPDAWYTIMLVQAISHVCSFLLPSLAYWYVVDKRRPADFNFRPLPAAAILALVALLVIAFMPFNGLIIEWNQGVRLPETLAPLDQWMRRQEDQLAELTKYLTTFNTVDQLLIALLVIAVLPALGEEMLFRGILQRKFIVWTGNVHVGIWLAAILFSAIHVQFFGFVPRVLLGALFGYLYVWSGNFWVPVLAHFVNNGFTVLMVYLHQHRLVSFDIENTDSVPVAGALVSLLVSVALLVYLRRSTTPTP